MKTYNTEFNEIIITFTDQNDRPLEIEDKVNLTFYKIEDEKIHQRAWIIIIHEKSIQHIGKNNYWILLLKKELDALKPAFKKVFHKASEARGEFKGNKIADKIVKPKPLPAENLRDNEKKIIAPD